MDNSKEQLVKYIKEQLQLGTQESILLNTIKSSGWTEQDYAELSKIAKTQLSPVIKIPEPTVSNTQINVPVSETISTSNSLIKTMPISTPQRVVYATKPKSSLGKIFFIVIILLLISSGAVFAYINKDILLNIPIIKSFVQKIGLSNILSNNIQTQSVVVATSTDSVVVPATTVPDGFAQYSNEAFSVLYPRAWTMNEGGSTITGCFGNVGFVNNPTSKAVLDKVQDEHPFWTDDLHYLAGTTSVIAINGGSTSGTTTSFETLKKFIINDSNIVTDNDKRLTSMMFPQEEVNITKKVVDKDSKIPSITYYFEFPKYNKNEIYKKIVIDGKVPQISSIFYVYPIKDYSETLFTTVVNSIQNKLKSPRCNIFESSKIDKRIVVSIPDGVVWKENNTYKVTWSTSLDLSSISYFVVQIGSDIPKKIPWAGIGGTSDYWKVDKTKNSLDIKINSDIINSQIANSEYKTFNNINDNFFVRVTAFTNVLNSNDKEVSHADSPLFIVEKSTAIPVVTNQISENDAAVSINNIEASMVYLRSAIMSIHNSYPGGSYEFLCKDDLIDVSGNSTHKDLLDTVNRILSYQGVTNQTDAGITCVSTKDKYALEIVFKKFSVSKNIYSFCMDSTNAAGTDSTYKLDKSSYSCKNQ